MAGWTDSGIEFVGEGAGCEGSLETCEGGLGLFGGGGEDVSTGCDTSEEELDTFRVDGKGIGRSGTMIGLCMVSLKGKFDSLNMTCRERNTRPDLGSRHLYPRCLELYPRKMQR